MDRSLLASMPVALTMAGLVAAAVAVVLRRSGSTFRVALVAGLVVLSFGAAGAPAVWPDPLVVVITATLAGLAAAEMAWRRDDVTRELCALIGGVVPLLPTFAFGYRFGGLGPAVESTWVTWLVVSTLVPPAWLWLWSRGPKDLASVRAATWSTVYFALPALAFFVFHGEWRHVAQGSAVLGGALVFDYVSTTGRLDEYATKFDNCIHAESWRLLLTSAVLGVVYPLWFAMVINRHQPPVVHHVMAMLGADVAQTHWFDVLAVAFAGAALIATRKLDGKQILWISGFLGLPTVLWALFGAGRTSPLAVSTFAAIVFMALCIAAQLILRIDESQPISHA